MKCQLLVVALLAACSGLPFEAAGGQGTTDSNIGVLVEALESDSIFRSVTVAVREPEVEWAFSTTTDPPVVTATTAACEEPLPVVSLARPGCPASQPGYTECTDEGHVCSYIGTPCTSFHECVWGMWRYVSSACTENEGASPGNSIDCPLSEPIPDSPCSAEGLSCGWAPCGTISQRNASCFCGRWVVGNGGRCHVQ